MIEGFFVKRKYNRLANGFTMIEIMMAVGVMMAALVPIVLAIGFGGKGTHATTREILATSYGSGLLEFVLNKEWGPLESAWQKIKADGNLKHEDFNYLDASLKNYLGLSDYLSAPEPEQNFSSAALDNPQFESDFRRLLKLTKAQLFSTDEMKKDYLRIEIKVQFTTESGQNMEYLFRGIKCQDGNT